MTTGRIAGETVVWLKRRREELSKANLAEYKRRLDETFVMRTSRNTGKFPNSCIPTSMSSVFIQGLSALQRRPGFASMARTS